MFCIYRTAKKDRIRQWIQASVIEEEDEGAVQEVVNEEDIRIHDNQNGPGGEKVLSRGPVADPRIKNNGHVVTFDESEKFTKRERRASSVSLRKAPDYYIPPIDPRIPLEQQKEQNASRKFALNGILKNGTAAVTKNGQVYNNHSEGRSKKVEDFNLKSALPFQNLHLVNSLSSSESGDSGSTVKHRINVQMPQTENYVYNETDMSRNGAVRNGVRHRSPPVNKRILTDERATRPPNVSIDLRKSSNGLFLFSRSPSK